MNQLPVEILSYIILFSFTPKDFIHLPTTCVAAHVCVLWRAIVTETPEFWTTITNQASESNIRLKLYKSANANIDILYYECSNRPTPGPRGMLVYPFLTLTIPHIDRWGFISTEGPAHYFMEALNAFSVIHNKRLPSWTIKPQLSYVEETVSLNRLPSSVVSIRLEGVFPSWGRNHTHSLIKIGHSLFPTVAQALKACPSLRTLRLGPLGPSTFRLRHFAGTPSDDGVSVMAPSLERLELRGADSGLFARFLQTVDMPKLSKLVIHSTNRSQLVDGIPASLSRDAGGRSLLQLVLDNAGGDSVSVSIGRATTLEWIKIHGFNGGRRILEVELLRKAGVMTGSMFKLKPVTVPVQLNVVGTLSGILPLLQRMPTTSHLRYRPHLDTGWQSLVLRSEDLTNLPSQWEHTLGPATSPLSAFIKTCYAWCSTEMRYGDPARERRLRDIELYFDRTS
ncbi:hypothetical protein FRC04_009985 [Tulasnella sp. 424]|nr:hypothetical protein FRC04_009985 [Tulasnella sp. 424]KAG8960846.1 hypothetical protein FRC05_006544 [Tulasnella sp. 425]